MKYIYALNYIYMILYDIVIQFKQCIVLYMKNEWFYAVNFVSIGFLIPKNLGLDTKIIFLSEVVENYTWPAATTAAILKFSECSRVGSTHPAKIDHLHPKP